MSTPVLAPSARSPRLAAVVFTDVVGYSARMQRDESGTIALMRADFEKMRAACLRHGGEVVNTMGDGMLMCFPSAANAATFALEIQAEFAARKTPSAQGEPLAHRIGIHLGDVVATGADDAGLQGDGVNIAARLEAKAPPNGICMSGAVFEQVKGKVRMNAHFAGSATLKNIAGPVPIWIVVPGGGAVKSRSRQRWWIAAAVLGACVVSVVVLQWGWRGEKKSALAPVGGTQVLAVLPFADMREGTPADHFADSLQEEILDALAGAGTWRLVSRTSASRFAGAASIRQVASELGATHVVEGSVRREGNEWRLTAQLIDVASDAHLFSFTDNLSVQFPAEDVQRQFATDVVARVRFILSNGTWAYPATDADMPERARLLYRQGAMELRYATQVGRTDLNVHRVLQEAHALAPSNGRILAMLAMAETREAGFGMAPEKMHSIEAELQEAERLSPGVPEAQLARAWLALISEQPAAEKLQAFDASTASLSDNYEWRLGRGFALRWNTRTEEALTQFESAIGLDPYEGLAAVNVALLRLRLRRLDGTIDYLTAVGKQWPLSPVTPIRLAVARLYRDGDVGQAKRAVDEWRTHYARKSDDLLLESLEIQLAWLEGRITDFDEQLGRYTQECLEDTGFPLMLSRIGCRVPLRLGELAVLGRQRELHSLAESTRLAAERALADTATILERNERALTLAQVYAFTGDTQRAQAALADLQPEFERHQQETPEKNRYLVDLAIGWLWAGDRDKALEVLATSLDAKGGTFATIVARDAIWCPLYDDARFARMLQAYGQQLVKHPGACRAMR